MKKVNLSFLLFFLLITPFIFGVIEETASFKDFLLGNAPDCEYDNWISHIAEGIASSGYNSYAPWDRQTDGFGDFHIPNETELNQWNSVISLFLNNQLDTAQDSIDHYGFPYEVVIFHDTDFDRTYRILREIPDMENYDDNGTSSHYDDELGAFDYGWGLYVYNPESPNPHITTAPHPNDDFTTVPMSYEVFTRQNSRFLLISGTGREVTWTHNGYYSNSKSTCDPSRVENHPFNVAYHQFCDEIRTEFGHREFSIQVHGYDWGTSHPGFPNVQISGGNYVDSPDLPIRDHSSLKLDIVNATEFLVHPANDIGIHPPVYINDFYGIHYTQFPFTYDNGDTTFVVSNHIDLPGFTTNRQMVYTQSGFSQYDVREPFFHIEMDELPNCYEQNTENYYWFYGWNPISETWDLPHRFDNAIAYYLPWVKALDTVLPFMYEMNDHGTPAPPSDLSAFSVCADNIVLEWTPGDCYDMDSYEILFATEPITQGNYTVFDRSNDAKLATLAETFHTVGGLNSGQDYYFQIGIRDKNGNYSPLSNEISVFTGPAKITNLKTIGRDGFVDISWSVPFQNSCIGFNIYRRTDGTDFEMIDGWETNPDLIGQDEDDLIYATVDSNVQNGETYIYQVASEDFTGQQYFYGTVKSAQPQKIFRIVVRQTLGTFADTCFFGMNRFASDGFDANTFDFAADDEASGDYFFAQFYEENWQNNNALEQEIYSEYNPDVTDKHWVLRFRTNQLDQEVEIGISNLDDRNRSRFYLAKNGQWTNLAWENAYITPSNTGFIQYDLYYGNLTPSVSFSAFANQLLFPNEIIDFNWNVNILESIDHVNVYAANDQIAIPIASDLAPSQTETSWSVPALLFENLKLRVDLIMLEGDTLSYFSPYGFGIITPQTIVSTPAGWSLISKNYETTSHTPQQIYGEDFSMFEMNEDESFTETESPEFLHPYWLQTADNHYITLNNAAVQRTAYDYQLHQGWNIIPNPHRINYRLNQLLFTLNDHTYEYYFALQNHFIEPFLFEYDGGFQPVSKLQSGKSYYLYCYEDDITLRYIPFYDNSVSPEFEDNWKLEITAGFDAEETSSVIVGTSPRADSLYNPYYDLLKPLAKPFETPIFSLPADFDGDSQFTAYHQILYPTENPENDFTLRWNADLQLQTLETIGFHIYPENMPENYFVYIQFGDYILELLPNEETPYNPADSLLEFSVLVTDYPLLGADENETDNQFYLCNYPNPFRNSTTISFEFSNEQNQQNKQKTISIYNIKGQKVKQLRVKNDELGINKIIWDGKDNFGKTVASGVYFYKLNLKNEKSIIKKMLLLR